MNEFIERFKRWLEQEKEEGNVTGWGLIDACTGWEVGVEVGGDEEFFVTIQPV